MFLTRFEIEMNVIDDLLSLSRIIIQVEQKAAIIEAKLKTISSLSTSNLFMKVLKKIIAFEIEIKTQVNDESHHYSFQKN